MEALFSREVGGFASNKHAHVASIQHSISSNEALIRRLTNHRQLDIVIGGSGGALCCSWDDAGVQLAVGTDTCQLMIFNADKGKVTHTFDPVSFSAQPPGLQDAWNSPLTLAMLLLPPLSCRDMLKALLVRSSFLGLTAGSWSQLVHLKT